MTQLPSAEALKAAPWRKSSFSGANNECVEVAPVDRWIAVRDSKAKGQGPALVFTASEWAAFLDGAKNGEFDN